jgi:hypothetical protein
MSYGVTPQLRAPLQKRGRGLKLAPARRFLRFGIPKSKTEFRFRNPLAVAPAALIRHATRSRCETLEADAARTERIARIHFTDSMCLPRILRSEELGPGTYVVTMAAATGSKRG